MPLSSSTNRDGEPNAEPKEAEQPSNSAKVSYLNRQAREFGLQNGLFLRFLLLFLLFVQLLLLGR